MTRLADQLTPCGPIIDPKAAERAHEAIAKRVGEAFAVVNAAWPALAPVFAASPYLTSLARRDGARLPLILEAEPETRLAQILDAAEIVAAEPDFETARRALRELKADLHLLTEADFKELGLSVGARRKIPHALRAQPPAQAAPAP